MTLIENDYDPHIPFSSSAVEDPELKESEARLFSLRNSIEVVSRVSTGDALLHVANSLRTRNDLRVVIRYILHSHMQFIECPSSKDTALVIAEEAFAYIKESLEDFLASKQHEYQKKEIDKRSREITEKELEYCFPEHHLLERQKKLEKDIEDSKNRLKQDQEFYDRRTKLREEAEIALETYTSLLRHIDEAKDIILPLP